MGEDIEMKRDLREMLGDDYEKLEVAGSGRLWVKLASLRLDPDSLISSFAHRNYYPYKPDDPPIVIVRRPDGSIYDYTIDLFLGLLEREHLSLDDVVAIVNNEYKQRDSLDISDDQIYDLLISSREKINFPALEYMATEERIVLLQSSIQRIPGIEVFMEDVETEKNGMLKIPFKLKETGEEYDLFIPSFTSFNLYETDCYPYLATRNSAETNYFRFLNASDCQIGITLVVLKYYSKYAINDKQRLRAKLLLEIQENFKDSSYIVTPRGVFNAFSVTDINSHKRWTFGFPNPFLDIKVVHKWIQLPEKLRFAILKVIPRNYIVSGIFARILQEIKLRGNFIGMYNSFAHDWVLIPRDIQEEVVNLLIGATEAFGIPFYERWKAIVEVDNGLQLLANGSVV